MREVIESIQGEYERYKTLGEGAVAQVADGDLSRPGPGGSNSLAVICWHLSGNLRSRFTEFLTSDGEKPWRNREEEFDERAVSRAEFLARWEEGWAALFAALAGLTDADLRTRITIRGQALTVLDALHRSLAHATYHVGQMVYLAKTLRAEQWTNLSIPRGQSQHLPAPWTARLMNGTHPTFTEIAPWLALSLFGFTLFWCFIVFVLSRMSGWATLAAAYPAGEVLSPNTRWRWQSALMNANTKYNASLTVVADPPGGARVRNGAAERRPSPLHSAVAGYSRRDAPALPDAARRFDVHQRAHRDDADSAEARGTPGDCQRRTLHSAGAARTVRSI